MSLLFSFILFHGGHAVVEQPKPEPIVMTMEVTAYTAHCPGCSGVTASGQAPIENVTIACPESMDLGTWIDIESVGRRRCDDRGGAIKKGHIDLFIPRLKDALKFGRRWLDVEVITSG